MIYERKASQRGKMRSNATTMFEDTASDMLVKMRLY